MGLRAAAPTPEEMASFRPVGEPEQEDDSDEDEDEIEMPAGPPPLPKADDDSSSDDDDSDDGIAMPAGPPPPKPSSASTPRASELSPRAPLTFSCASQSPRPESTSRAHKPRTTHNTRTHDRQSGTRSRSTQTRTCGTHLRPHAPCTRSHPTLHA